MPATSPANTSALNQTRGCRYQRTAAPASAFDPDFTLSTGIDPRRHGSGTILTQALAPGRHYAVATVAHRVRHACEVATIQPHIVGQIGCADLLVAASVRSVARDADGFEARLARGDPVFRRFVPVQREHV